MLYIIGLLSLMHECVSSISVVVAGGGADFRYLLKYEAAKTSKYNLFLQYNENMATCFNIDNLV